MTYYTNASRAARIGPNDLPGSIAIIAGPDRPGDLIGIAYAVGHIGGWRWDWSRPDRDSDYLGPMEALWRPAIGKAEAEAEAEGRFVLRGGAFVVLAEGAE
jgi:hypothetical protein